MNKFLILVALLLAAIAGAFFWLRPAAVAPPGPNSPVSGRPVVYTTFYPTEYWTARLGHDLVEVRCPILEDEDPIFWEPAPAVIAAYQQADLIVANGAGFEKWLTQATLPAAKLVDTALPFAGEFITFENATTHSHGPKGEHVHAGIDGHTWLDPNLAKIQVGEIHKALARLLPAEVDELRSRYQSLVSDLEDLDRAFRALASRDERWVLASHPAYNYLARRYDWKIESLDLDPEEMPSDAALAEIGTILASHPARAILWESAPTPEIAQRLEERFDLASFVVSPCELLGKAEREAGLDYLKVMQANVEALRAAFAL